MDRSIVYEVEESFFARLNSTEGWNLTLRVSKKKKGELKK